MTASENLNDSFGGLTVTVSGHTPGAIDTGSGANDTEFVVNIDETADTTGATALRAKYA